MRPTGRWRTRGRHRPHRHTGAFFCGVCAIRLLDGERDVFVQEILEKSR